MTGNNMEPEPNDSEALLRVRGVSKHFGGLWAVRDVSFDVAPSEIVGLIGPNGAGKTTLFNVLSRFLPADQGEIWFGDHALHRCPTHRVVHLGLLRTFQLSRVFSRMTVLENMLVSALDQPGEGLARAVFAPRHTRKRELELRSRAMTLLQRFRLDALKDEYAGALSGGQRKLLELARSLMVRPRMLLLDEPMAGVNPALKGELLEHILDLRDHGMTFLIVEHDMDMIMRISDRILVMADGRLIAQGDPDSIRSTPEVVTAYLGDEVGGR